MNCLCFQCPHLGDSCLARSRPPSAASCQPRAFPKVHSSLHSCFSPRTHQHKTSTNISSKLRLESLFSCLTFKNLVQLRTLQLALGSCYSSSPSTGKLHWARSWSRVTTRSWNIWYWNRRERIRSATMASQAALISETIAAMKKAVKRKAYGMLPSSINSPFTLANICPIHRLGLRCFHRPAHQSRQQVEEEGKICSRGSIGTTQRASSLQKSPSPSPEQSRARADALHRKSNMQNFIERS